jgi:hypothetical protein
MSPEQAQGLELDSRSDIYGLGVIVYQMLSGRQPYSADTPMGVVIKHVTEPVPEILNMAPNLPLEVDQLIKRAMAKDRNKRYETAVDLAKAMNMVAFGNEGNFTSVTNAGIRTGLQKALPAAQASRGKVGLIAGAAVVLVLAVGVFLLRNQLFAPTVEPTLSSPPTATPTEVPSTSTSVSTPTPVPAATETLVSFAPACAAGALIATPAVKETNKDCVSKKPYTLISIPEGATFTPLDEALICNEERTADGKTIISCTGQMLYSYNLKVCLPPVMDSADAGKCEQGSTFDSANRCCFPTPPDGAGCAIFKADIGACQ